MKLTVENNTAKALQFLRTTLPARVACVGTQIARAIATKAAEQVASRIPSSPAPYAIYRNAIRAYESEDGTQFAVAADPASIVTTSIDGALDLITFDSSSDITKVLVPYNPWTSDTIPPIQGGYTSPGVVVRRAGGPAVAQNRARLRPLLAVVNKALNAAGAAVGGHGAFVFVNGQCFTDMVFLARQLELGLGGFPARPHWGPARSATRGNAPMWGNSTAATVDRILSGETPPATLPRMSSGQADEFAAARERS